MLRPMPPESRTYRPPTPTSGIEIFVALATKSPIRITSPGSLLRIAKDYSRILIFLFARLARTKDDFTPRTLVFGRLVGG